jgi:regulator of nucleoside diphosphate kinase
VTLTELDRFRLGRLLNCAETAAMTPRRSRFALEARLEDAQAIPVDAAPRSLVTMNSTLRLTDLDSGTQRVCRLVYPDDRDLFPQSVGVFQPLGLRLLGRQVGESIQLPVNGQTKRFRIDSILYQPEAAGELAR